MDPALRAAHPDASTPSATRAPACRSPSSTPATRGWKTANWLRPSRLFDRALGPGAQRRTRAWPPSSTCCAIEGAALHRGLRTVGPGAGSPSLSSGALRVGDGGCALAWRRGRWPTVVTGLARGARRRQIERARTVSGSISRWPTIYRRLGNVPQALAAYNAVLAYQGDQPEALWGRAATLALDGQWDAAVKPSTRPCCACAPASCRCAATMRWTCCVPATPRLARAQIKAGAAARSCRPRHAGAEGLAGPRSMEMPPPRSRDRRGGACDSGPWSDLAVDRANGRGAAGARSGRFGRKPRRAALAPLKQRIASHARHRSTSTGRRSPAGSRCMSCRRMSAASWS